MNSMISASLWPCRTFSRTWLRRSAARSALESAIVWFWHTRQRSSAESAMTLPSIAGSGAAGTASRESAGPNGASTRAKSSNLPTTEFLHQRKNFFLEYLCRDRADALVADYAALVDHVGLGHAIDAVVDADPAVGVESRQLVGIAHVLQPRQAFGALVLVVQAVDRHDSALREIEQHRVFLAAADAP